ncbi:SWIM zinc finger family protein [Bacillus pinisoli]|uniref:SWIM zinc finger family protein n=1 Tax=Bacillus pinisoli TaxID=2901866 RepID=UPI001FF41B62|nr:SWIM zinc finger family protein [Bacillus pinisoli]
MLQSDLIKEQLLYCANEIKTELSPEIDYDRDRMKKGLNLYRQGRVYNVVTEERFIEAKVQEEEVFDVTLDLDVFVLSQCSCSTGGICRHKLAVFFYAYALVDRVGVFFQEWKENKKVVITKNRSKVLGGEEEEQTELVGEKIGGWYSFFKKEYHVYKEKEKNNRFSFNAMFQFESIYKDFFNKLRGKAPQVPYMRELFIIHAASFSMQKLVEESEQSRLSLGSKDNYVYPYVNQLVDVIHDRLNDLKKLAFPLSGESLLVETKEKISQLLYCGNEYQYERLISYFMVWITLLHRKNWIHEEQKILLQKQEQFIARKQSQAVDCQFALAHMAYLEKKDQQAIELLSKIQGNYIKFCFFWAGTLSLTKEWNRQSIWLNHSLELLKNYNQLMMDYHSKRNMTRQFLPLFAEHADETNKPDAYTEAMKSLLPYSFIEYNDFLIDEEDYQTWADLQMLVGYDISDQSRELIKHIEKTDRRILLPLYHRAVNDAIAQKSRPAYKQAIRYLKKLRTQYRQLKLMTKWDAYIERLAHEHKRLRAFQEELEKGKLLHD